jgi:UDP-glucose 4-epimerase
VRVLITGGAGFIGSHVADAYVSRGDQVTIIDDLSTGTFRNIADAVKSGSVNFVEASVLDVEVVHESMKTADLCLHFAAMVGVSLVTTHPLDCLMGNIRGSETVISAAAKSKCRLLYASTSEVYGKNSDPFLSEAAELVLGPPSAPRWAYSHAKAVGEVLAQCYFREHGAETVVVRIFNAVGARQSGQYGMVLPRFVDQALAGDDVTVFGDGTQERCFTHIADLVAAILGLCDSPRAIGRIFNVGSRSPIQINQLAEKVVTRVASSSRIVHVPYEFLFGGHFDDLSVRVPNTDAVESFIGWKPAHSLDEAIDDVIAYARRESPGVGGRTA